MAGFRALKMYLSFSAECQQRVYRLDYVAAFLQADVIRRMFTKFLEQWKDLLRNYPDLHHWLGVPSRLKKTLTGIASTTSPGRDTVQMAYNSRDQIC
jgi:hypothetical protein